MTSLNAFKPFFGMVLNQIDKMNEAKRINKERVLREWEESKNLPRKKKKAKRKELNLEWSIYNWEPFEGYDESAELLKSLLEARRENNSK